MDDQELQIFNLLTQTLAKMLTFSQVQRVKRELKGHVSREKLIPVKSGEALMNLLTMHGFLHSNKLMFFKKVLNHSHLFEAEDILSEYIARRRNGNILSNEDKRLIDLNTKRRLKSLEDSIQLGYTAIKYKKEQLDCENEEVDRRGIAIDLIRHKIVSEEGKLDDIITKMKQKNGDLARYETHQEEVSQLVSQNDRSKSKIIEEISAKEAEIRMLGRNPKERKSSGFSLDHPNLAVDKIHQAIERLRREVINVAKERERLDYKLEHIKTRKEKHKDVLRVIQLEKIAKLKEIVQLENNLIKLKEEYCQQSHNVCKIKLEIIALEGAIEENVFEKDRTSNHTLHARSDFLPRAYKKVQRKMANKQFQVLEYGNLDELDSHTFGETGSRLSPLQFKSPANVAFNRVGNLLILDKGNKRVLCTDVTGNGARLFADLGNVFEPIDMTINHNGQLILMSNSLIKVFSDTGDFIFQFLPHFDSTNELPELSGVSVNNNNDILVCDAKNKNIQCFDEHGMFLRSIRLGDLFYSPNRLTVSGTSDLIVCDSMDHNLKVVDISAGKMTKPKIIGCEGVCLNEFILPCGMAVDSDNNILVADSGNHRIQVLDGQKEPFATFGRLGSRPGCLDRPSGVAVHPFGLVAVADTMNDRIVIFS